MSQRMPVLAGITSIALIAGGGALAAPVAASATPGTHRAAGGVITTVAGGVGGPGPARGISLNSVNAPPIACGTPPGPCGRWRPAAARSTASR
jgi:hypothetical protein